MLKLQESHSTPPRHSPRYPRPHTSHHNWRSLLAFFSASPKITQPAELARTPLWILRKHLDRTCSAAEKEVQQVPSGLGLQLLMERREALEGLLQESKVEVEQKWAIFALPNVQQQFISYDGTQVPINEQMALDEFKLQTALSPPKFYFSNKNPLSSTLIMAVPEDQARAVPKWINCHGLGIVDNNELNFYLNYYSHQQEYRI
ncbi:uncharacterized protein ASPGLDRAFT_1353542 [Aspergillus glaucus CBS 516.65]|uniref:Uncharacterized protein n=1 Tax=Aspergillus glaucus CBS 516.65 TaxID=1160497 RepID=A0A1L9VNI2_ASPGL|nr:hypothetical protein ASPGLDRAFT_1353542 [Aspergillus glaucus CBS 516.65]OJJ85454.1 hypothetical protein ASPGLDRAFT_1353542 [Aspergillus glaucus CBS 516.65]